MTLIMRHHNDAASPLPTSHACGGGSSFTLRLAGEGRERSRPALPAPAVVGLPISHRKSARFGALPVVPGLGNRFVIAAVEQQYDAIVSFDILRHRRPVDQKTHS